MRELLARDYLNGELSHPRRHRHAQRGAPEGRRRTRPNSRDSQATAKGKIDAFLAAEPVGQGQIDAGVALRRLAGGRLHLLPVGVRRQEIGPLVKAFVARVDEIIQGLQADGTLAAASRKWFGHGLRQGCSRIRHRLHRAEGRVTERQARTSRWTSRSLMARLVLTFLALSLLMAGIVGVVSYLRARSSLESQVFNRLDAAEQLKADSLDRWLDEQRRNVVFVGGLLGGYISGNASGSGLAQATQSVLEGGPGGARGTPAHASVEAALKYVVRRPPTPRSCSCSTSTAPSSPPRCPSTRAAIRPGRRGSSEAVPAPTSSRSPGPRSRERRRSRSRRRSSTASGSASASSRAASTFSGWIASCCPPPASARRARPTWSAPTVISCTRDSTPAHSRAVCRRGGSTARSRAVTAAASTRTTRASP